MIKMIHDFTLHSPQGIELSLRCSGVSRFEIAAFIAWDWRWTEQ